MKQKMESNNSIEELIIRYLQNEIQEDELRVLDAWIHESDANKAHFFELKGLFDTRKEVAFLNHYSVERSWERMAGKLDAISGVSVKSKVLGKQFWLSFLRYAANSRIVLTDDDIRIHRMVAYKSKHRIIVLIRVTRDVEIEIEEAG